MTDGQIAARFAVLGAGVANPTPDPARLQINRCSHLLPFVNTQPRTPIRPTLKVTGLLGGTTVPASWEVRW